MSGSPGRASACLRGGCKRSLNCRTRRRNPGEGLPKRLKPMGTNRFALKAAPRRGNRRSRIPARFPFRRGSHSRSPGATPDQPPQISVIGQKGFECVLKIPDHFVTSGVSAHTMKAPRDSRKLYAGPGATPTENSPAPAHLALLFVL